MSLRIKEVFIEYQKNPLGLDEKKPRFSWLLEADEKNTIQTACRIQVWREEICVWDSQRLETRESKGICYEGEALEPCTFYQVKVVVWDNHGNEGERDTFFETGLMNPEMDAWEGAEWIGAPRYTVCAENRGVFILETEFRMEKGFGRAGVVFGAKDFRLLDHTKNELGLEGENFIRFECNLKEDIPQLDIYRVGYAPEDKEEVPFASVELVNFQGEDKVPVITRENMGEFHKFRIEVDGNNSMTYVDDVLVDAVEQKEFWGTKLTGRTLNPRGNNDVLTYPRLNEIGFFAEGTKAFFKNITVRNMR